MHPMVPLIQSMQFVALEKLADGAFAGIDISQDFAKVGECFSRVVPEGGVLEELSGTSFATLEPVDQAIHFSDG